MECSYEIVENEIETQERSQTLSQRNCRRCFLFCVIFPLFHQSHNRVQFDGFHECQRKIDHNQVLA